MKRHSLSVFEPGTGEFWFPLGFIVTMVSGGLFFGFLQDSEIHDALALIPLLFLFIGIAAPVLCATHEGFLMSNRAHYLLRNYRTLSPELQAQIPLSREMLKNWNQFNYSEQTALESSMKELLALQREKNLAMRQVPANYTVLTEALADAKNDAKRDLDIVKQVQRELG